MATSAMMMDTYTKDGKLWVQDPEKDPAKNQAWVIATIQSVDSKGGKLFAKLEGGSKDEILLDTGEAGGSFELANPDNYDTVDDLTELSFLHEPAVLHCLDVRFCEQQLVYTLCGIVLVVINPYTEVPGLHGTNQMKEYQSKHETDCDPHIYSVAKKAIDNLKIHGKNQSIIVSGESGAGKTYSAKNVMEYFANVGADVDDYSGKVLATNPVMEAFGNAKTTRNDNSSRFGKYLALNFNSEGSILGAAMRTYLLEKSRVVFQTDTERNYHVFYLLCAKSDDPEFAELQLRPAEDFGYTNQGGDAVDVETDREFDAEEFDDLKASLLDLDIAEDVVKQLWAVLAAVLHIGDIAIESAGSEGSKIDPADPALLLSAKLLGIEPSAMVKTITQFRIKPPGEDFIEKNNNLGAAENSRDALVKHIYSNVFDWLVGVINKTLMPSKEAARKPFIGVLDIYGFEHFVRNSYEQFCINYANEKLQNQFNHHVFTLEQNEYEEEEIDWSMVHHKSNTPCIELIESKTKGLFSLLDDECRMGNRGSDKNWGLRIHKKFDTNPHFAKPSAKMGGDEAFIVKHYADDVCYDVLDFLNKNRDAISADHTILLTKATNALVKSIFGNQKSGNNKRAGRGPVRGGSVKAKDLQKPTVAKVFQESLQDLMDDLGKTDPHFVRCLKPNDQKNEFEFHKVRVVEQLRACGVLETIRISAAGYPGRFTFADFLSRYELLLTKKDLARAKASNKKFANVRRALTSSDLKFYVSLWQHVGPVKQDNGQVMLEAAKAFEFFQKSNLDPAEELSKIWTLSKDDNNPNKLLMMKSEFYDACKYCALTQDYTINGGNGLAALDMSNPKAVKRVRNELGEKCQQPQFDVQLAQDAGPKRASVYVRDEASSDERFHCEVILEKAISPMLKDQYQVGKTKLFFKAGFVAGQLEKIRARVIEEGKIKVKAQMQMWRTRREYKRKLQATQTLQRFTRGWIDRKAVRQLRRVQAMEVIQRYVRRWIVLKKVRADRYKKLLEEKSEVAATTIQKAYKAYKWRKDFAANAGKMAKSILLMQSCARRWLAKKKVDTLRAIANDPTMLKAKAAQASEELEMLREEKNARVAGLKVEILILKGENEKLTAQYSEAAETLEITEEEVEMVKGQLQELQGEYAEDAEDNRECISGMSEKISELQKTISEQEILGQAESQKVLMLKGQLAEAREAANDNEDLLDVQHKLVQAETDREQLELDLNILTESHEELQAQNETLKAEVDIGVNAEIGKLQAEIAALREAGGGGSGGGGDVDMLNADLKTAQAEINAMRRKLDARPEDLTDKYAEAMEEVARLTIRRDAGADDTAHTEVLRQQIDELSKEVALQNSLVQEKTKQMRHAIGNAQAAERDYQELLVRNEMLEEQLALWMNGHGNRAGPPPAGVQFRRTHGHVRQSRPQSASFGRRRVVSAQASSPIGAYPNSAPLKPAAPRMAQRGGSVNVGHRQSYSGGY